MHAHSNCIRKSFALNTAWSLPFLFIQFAAFHARTDGRPLQSPNKLNSQQNTHKLDVFNISANITLYAIESNLIPSPLYCIHMCPYISYDIDPINNWHSFSFSIDLTFYLNRNPNRYLPLNLLSNIVNGCWIIVREIVATTGVLSLKIRRVPMLKACLARIQTRKRY